MLCFWIFKSRNHSNSYSTNSSSVSTSLSAGSTSTSSGNFANFATTAPQMYIDVDRPLPKTPDEDEARKKSKLKQTKDSLSQGIQAISNTLFPKKLHISKPINFYHEVHVTFNPETGEFEVITYFPFKVITIPLFILLHLFIYLLCLILSSVFIFVAMFFVLILAKISK